MTTVLVSLTLAASLSPLLTFAKLFQLKEWRLDRLREHFHIEGYVRQLFGITRPAILGFFACISFLGFPPSWPLVFLATITVLNAVQILLKKQPCPTWTQKAITLTTTTLIMTGLTSYVLLTTYSLSIVLLPLLQPLFLLTSWALWKPVDSLLKRRILRQAAALRAQFPNLTIIGITGSAGKTTTKGLLAHLLNPHAVATPEHVNTELGVAQWLLRTLHTTHYTLPTTLIVEMGAYREGEIRTLCSVAKPTIGIITSIGTQHIGLFGSQKAIAAAKGELFAALPPNGHAFLNSENPFAQELRKQCACSVTTVSIGIAADVLATHIEDLPEGLCFRIGTVPFAVPLHGEHQIGNVLLAIATATRLGMTLEETAKKLKTFPPLAHTFSLQETHGIHMLDDTHNASPESLRAAIEWARSQPHTPKILVSPGIIEQGSCSARTHVRCGTIAKDVFDEAFVLNKKFAQYFEQGFGKPVKQRVTSNEHLPAGSLLVCVGRVPQATIQKFLP